MYFCTVAISSVCLSFADDQGVPALGCSCSERVFGPDKSRDPVKPKLFYLL